MSRTGATIDLVGILLPMLPEQLLTFDKKITRKRILEAIIKAEQLDVRLVTLGAFTSIVTSQGESVVDESPIAITSGNSYTAAICVKTILEITRQSGKNIKDLSVSIIGATGDIGSLCANMLSRHVNEITLCSRKISSFNKIFSGVKQTIGHDPIVCNDAKEAVKNADIVICATSNIVPLLDEQDIKIGSIFCDISVPPSMKIALKEKRFDILAFEGGRASFLNFSNIQNKKWKILFPANLIYGCLAEALILGFEQRYENYSLGQDSITADKAEEIFALGVKHGFSVPSLEDLKGIIKNRN